MNLRRNLMPKNEYFESNGHKFSHISEMNIVFLTELGNMTYEHYLKIPKPMIEWRLNAILAENPEIIKEFTNISHPLIRNIVILLTMKKFKILCQSFQIISSKETNCDNNKLFTVKMENTEYTVMSVIIYV